MRVEGGGLRVEGGGCEATDEFVDGDLVEQRQVLVAIAGDVGGLYIILHKVTQQRALQPPLGISLRVGRNGAEVGRNSLSQGQRLLLSVQLRADKLEVDEQSLLVVDNLRLVGDHLDVGGIAVALVVDDKCKLGRHHRLNLVGQCIVA